MKTIERVRRTAVSTNEWEPLRNVGRTHDQRGTLASAPSGRRMVAYGDCCGAATRCAPTTNFLGTNVLSWAQSPHGPPQSQRSCARA